MGQFQEFQKILYFPDTCLKHYDYDQGAKAYCYDAYCKNIKKEPNPSYNTCPPSYKNPTKTPVPMIPYIKKEHAGVTQINKNPATMTTTY